MRASKLHHLFGIIFVTLCLGAIPLQSQAANASAKPSKATQSDKDRLVLMPMRLEDDLKKLQGSLESALVEGLQQKYIVFSGEQVSHKAREIFLKETRLSGHTECDETRCMQKIAGAFQAELLATANVTKQDGGYFLALSIQNIFDNKVEYSKSIACAKCTSFQLIEKLKELSGAIAGHDGESDEPQKETDRKLKAVQLKKEQQEFEGKVNNSDATERKRLLNAKAVPDNSAACYTDDFVRVCVTKSVIAKNNTPSLTLNVKNMTGGILFLGKDRHGYADESRMPYPLMNTKITDDDGNACGDIMTGLEAVYFDLSEDAYNRIAAGKSANIHVRWPCSTKVTGNMVVLRLYFVRLTDGKAVPFVATIPDIAWRK